MGIVGYLSQERGRLPRWNKVWLYQLFIWVIGGPEGSHEVLDYFLIQQYLVKDRIP